MASNKKFVISSSSLTNSGYLNYFHGNSNFLGAFKDFIDFSFNEYSTFNTIEEAQDYLSYMQDEYDRVLATRPLINGGNLSKLHSILTRCVAVELK